MLSPSTTPRELASLLGTSYSNLTYVVYGQGVAKHYSEFSIPKKNGELRVIQAPSNQLKVLQRRLKTQLELIYLPHDAATAFINGRGVISNSVQHVQKKAVLNLDLEDFFHQINFGRVYGLLKAKPYSLRPDTARIIAHICCVGGRVPQGSPTSPVISNMICKRLDRELSLLSSKNKAFYTRYADDLTFSFHKLESNEIYVQSYPPLSIFRRILRTFRSLFSSKSDNFPAVHVTLSKTLVNIIESNGFKVNSRKTRLQLSNQRQVVTGLKVNLKVNIDRRFVRTTHAMIHSMEKGEEYAKIKYADKTSEEKKDVTHVVYGRIAFIGMIKGRESSVYLSLASRFNNTYALKKLSTQPSKSNPKLERELYFPAYHQRARLAQCVWVVIFEGIEGDDIDELVQGTAFMIAGQKLITAKHLFDKAGKTEECYVYRISEPSKKFKAKCIQSDSPADVVQLEFVDLGLPIFHNLSISPILDLKPGYMLSIVGFPELMPGHESVGITPCQLINNLVISTVRHGEVDTMIRAGNSGGPILNKYMQVVGMARIGQTFNNDPTTNKIQADGSNFFVYAGHFPS